MKTNPFRNLYQSKLFFSYQQLKQRVISLLKCQNIDTFARLFTCCERQLAWFKNIHHFRILSENILFIKIKSFIDFVQKKNKK